MPSSPVPESAVRGRVSPQRLWFLPALLLLAAVLIAAFGEPARVLLRYERYAVADYELWRLLTGHLVHLGWTHLGMNAAGLLLVWVLFGRYLSAAAWLGVIAATMVGIDAGFLLLRPDLVWYVGLSGVLHGMLAAGAAVGYREHRLESTVLALLLAAKLGWEQVGGAVPGSASVAGGPVVVDAHLYGTVAGILAVLPLLIRERRRRTL